jgi:hypothetical protein
VRFELEGNYIDSEINKLIDGEVCREYLKTWRQTQHDVKVKVERLVQTKRESDSSEDEEEFEDTARLLDYDSPIVSEYQIPYELKVFPLHANGTTFQFNAMDTEEDELETYVKTDEKRKRAEMLQFC